MAQQRIAVDGYSGVQPKKFDWNFETTYTSDSTRTMSGKGFFTPMFTVEAFSVEFPEMDAGTMARVLQIIVPKRGKPYFTLHYYSPYFNMWRDAQFYVGQGSLVIKTMKKGAERAASLTCNFVGREPL